MQPIRSIKFGQIISAIGQATPYQFKNLFTKYGEGVQIGTHRYTLLNLACVALKENFVVWLVEEKKVKVNDDSLDILFSQYNEDKIARKNLDKTFSLIEYLIQKNVSTTSCDFIGFATAATEPREYALIAPKIEWFRLLKLRSNEWRPYFHLFINKNPALVIYAIENEFLLVDQKEPHSQTNVLQAAAQAHVGSEDKQKYKKLLELCIKKTQQPNISLDNESASIIFFALKRNEHWLMDLLLNNPFTDLNQAVPSSPPEKAVKVEGNIKKEVLRKEKEEQVLTFMSGLKLLHAAAQSDYHFKYLKYFIEEKKMDPNQKIEKTGETPLMIAIIFRQLANIKFLLNPKYLDIDQENFEGDTALIMAIAESTLEITQILLNAGFDPLKQNSTGIDALFYAWFKQKKEMLDLLLSYTASRMSLEELKKNPVLKKEYFFKGEKYAIEFDLSKKNFLLPYVEEKPLTGRQALIMEGYHPTELERSTTEEERANSKTEVEETIKHTWLNGKLSYESDQDPTCIFPFEKSITKTPNCYFYFNSDHLMSFGCSEDRAKEIGKNLKLKFVAALGYQGLKEYKGNSIEVNGQTYPVNWRFKTKSKEVGKETRLPCIQILSDKKEATLFVPVGLVEKHQFFKKEKLKLEFDPLSHFNESSAKK